LPSAPIPLIVVHLVEHMEPRRICRPRRPVLLLLVLVVRCQAWDLRAPAPQLHGCRRRCGVLAMETVHTTATETPAHVTRLVEALSLAVSDRRRVDELVTLFEYDGLVEAAGERYSGQGAVKRFFSSLLLENGFTSMDVLAEPSSDGADDAALRLGLTSATGTDEVALRVKFSNGMVRECHLQAAEGACGPAGCLLPSASEPSENGGGPKWETFDGRVRQKIWQRPGDLRG